MVYSLPQITLKLLIFIFSTQLFVINSQRVNRINSGKRRHSIPVKIGEYPQVQEANAPIRRQSIFRPDDNGDVYEYHRFQHYGFKTPAPNTFSLESMLAFLAPLATLPIITSAALTSLASILPTLTTDGMVKGRSRREALLGSLDSMPVFNYSQWKSKSNNESYPIKRDVRDLDIIQKYLKQMNPKEDYNDEVMASYLQCSGMLSSNNHCLERLVCQFSDPNSRMDTLEKDVSSLIIYTILNNKHIHEEFKERLRTAAFFGRDTNGRCSYYICSRNNFQPL